MKLTNNTYHAFTNPDNGAILSGEALNHAEETPWLKVQIAAGVYTVVVDEAEPKPKADAKK